MYREAFWIIKVLDTFFKAWKFFLSEKFFGSFKKKLELTALTKISKTVFYLAFFDIKWKAMAGHKTRNTSTRRTFIKNSNTISPNASLSVPKSFAVQLSQVLQNTMKTTKNKMANKIPIRKVLKRKFLQKIIFSFSMF